MSHYDLITADEPMRGPETGRLSRRQLMRRALAAGLASSAAGALLAACGGTTAATPTASSTGAATAAGGAASKAAPTTSSASSAASVIRPTLAPVTGTPVRGGALVGGQQGDWKSYDPHRQNSSASFALIYDSLVHWGVQPDGSVKAEPALATEWQLNNDSAIFKLRQGVKFHDGSDWNADVAKFNIDRLLDPKSTAKAYISAIKSADVVDPYTLKLNLKAPSGPLLSNLSDAADNQVFMISKLDFPHSKGRRSRVFCATSAVLDRARTFRISVSGG